MTTRRALASISLAGLGALTAVNPLRGGPTGAAVRKPTVKSTIKRIEVPKTIDGRPTSTMPVANSSTNSGSAAIPPPNILFVLADDLGVDASPCYPAFGVVKPTMPTLDRLCAEGVVFDNMTASPVCSPSRAAALTGKYGFRTNVGNVDDELSANEDTIHDVVATAPTPYANAVIGKWHLGGSLPDPTQPSRLGVRYFDGFLRGQVPNYSNWPRVLNGAVSNSTTYTTTAFTDSAIAWIAKQQSPWFLWLAYNAGHTPFHMPPSSLVTDPTLTGTALDITRNPQKYYFAALEAMDKELGRLLLSLPPGVRRNTVVMFMGDNGTPARVVQTPFSARSAKGTVSEGGVHVPLVVAGAGVTQRGTRNASLLNGVDVHATIVELAKAKGMVPIDGVSFAPLLTTAGGQGTRTFAYSELFTGTAPVAGAAGGVDPDVWAVRDSRFKLVHDELTGSEQLFDLVADPSESLPLALSGANAAVADGLRTFATNLRSS